MTSPDPQVQPQYPDPRYPISPAPILYPPGAAGYTGGYGHPPIPMAAYLPVRPSSPVAVWALVLGLVGLLAGWCMLAVPCIAAVVLGHVGEVQTRNEAMGGRGMAVAGLVLGYVSLIPALIFLFWVFADGAAAAGR